MDLCRRSVRLAMGKDRLNEIHALPLPESLKSYLLYQWPLLEETDWHKPREIVELVVAFHTQRLMYSDLFPPINLLVWMPPQIPVSLSPITRPNPRGIVKAGVLKRTMSCPTEPSRRKDPSGGASDNWQANGTFLHNILADYLTGPLKKFYFFLLIEGRAHKLWTSGLERRDRTLSYLSS